MSCHPACPLFDNVARQTRRAPRGVAVSALQNVADPTQICQLPCGLPNYDSRTGGNQASSTRHKRAQKYRPTAFRANGDSVGIELQLMML